MKFNHIKSQKRNVSQLLYNPKSKHKIRKEKVSTSLLSLQMYQIQQLKNEY